MSIPYVVDGETDLDSLLFNPWVDALNGVSGPLANMRVGTANVLDYGADSTGADDSTQAIIDAQAAGHPYFPAGEYRITTTIPGISNRTWSGVGERSRIINDRSDSQRQRQTCILPGNLHPTYIGVQMVGYDLATITAGDRVITCSTAGNAANFAVGELVFFGSKTLNGTGVPKHAQLTKIRAINSGAITIQDPCARAISDGAIWKIAGTDTDSGWPIYAIENFSVENLYFEGLSMVAPKGGVYGGAFRNIGISGHQGIATNTLTNFLIENVSGQYGGRELELAFNSYNVTIRNYGMTFVPPTFSGDTVTHPIQVGEQTYNAVLDNVRCYVSPDYTTSTSIASLRGSNIVMRDCDWRHDGTNSTGASVVQFPESGFAGQPSRNLAFQGGRISGGAVARLVLVGDGLSGVTDQNPQEVTFNGTILDGTPSVTAITFYSGKGHRCGAINRTGKSISVGSNCAYPDLTGYQGAI